MFKFIPNANGEFHSGKLIYRKAENSFDFVPSSNADVSLLAGYLHMGVDSETQVVQQIWGLCPFDAWKKKTLNTPNFVKGKLLIEGNIKPSMSYRIEQSENWDIQYDNSTGWICIGESKTSGNDVAVNFAEGIIAVISEGALKSLWLNPEMED